jgi:hypothetical protein
MTISDLEKCPYVLVCSPGEITAVSATDPSYLNEPTRGHLS